MVCAFLEVVAVNEKKILIGEYTHHNIGREQGECWPAIPCWIMFCKDYRKILGIEERGALGQHALSTTCC